MRHLFRLVASHLPTRLPHFLDYLVPPCLLLPLFFLPPSLGASWWSADHVHDTCFYSHVCALLMLIVSARRAGPLGGSDPPPQRLIPLLAPLRLPSPSLLTTRKRLALLTPSRGLALVELEKRPPGWAGRKGGGGRGEEEKRGRREGGGPVCGAIGQRRCPSRCR